MGRTDIIATDVEKDFSTEIEKIKKGQSYRDTNALNVSTIKTFRKEGYRAFYNEYVLKVKSKEKDYLDDNYSIILGSLFDYYRIDCNGSIKEFEEKFDDKFSLFDGIKKSGQDYELADELFRQSRECYEDGKFKFSFKDRFTWALEKLQSDGKFKGKTFDKALESFTKKGDDGNSAESYFNEKVSNINKTIVDLGQINKVNEMISLSNSDEFVSKIMNYKDCLNKLSILWKWETIGYGDILCKSELDKVNLDKSNKIAYPIDIKTIFNNDRYYIRLQYYKLLYGWQGAFYTKALRYYLDNNGMSDYKIAPFTFIFFSTSPTRIVKDGEEPLIQRPALLRIDDPLMDEALNGINKDSYKFPGLNETMQEIGFHLYNNEWSCSFEQFYNNGFVSI